MRWAFAIVLLVIIGGCLRPALVECGELACAPTQVCHENRCLDPSRLDSCKDVDEGAACDVLGEPGHCTNRVCESATCGDGYVDVELREECDGSVSLAHCIDFGFDAGRAACTACQPDPSVGCTRFGWERIVDAPSTALWTDGTTLAYLTTSALHVQTPTGAVTVPGTFGHVHGSGNHVIAFLTTTFVDVIDGIVTSRSLPSIDHARISDDGTVYALADCVASVVDGNALEPLAPAVGDGVCSRIEVSASFPDKPRVFVAAGSTVANRVYRLDRGRGLFVAVSPAGAPISDMRFHGDRLWVMTTSGVYTIDDNDQRTDIGIGFGALTVAFADGAAYLADGTGRAARVRGTRVQRFRAPGMITGDGAVYSYRGPIYRFTGTDYGARLPILSELEVVSVLEDAGDVIVATKRAFHVADDIGVNWSNISSSSRNIRAFTGGNGMYFVSEFDNPPAARDPELRTAEALTGPWIRVNIPATPTPLVWGMWWSPTDQTLFAVGDNDAGDAYLGVRRGTTMWENAFRTGCTVRGVHGTDAAHVIAVGGCGGESVVWRYDGTQWTELARPALPAPLLAAVHFADGSLAVTGESGTARFDGTAWSVDTSVVGSWISGTSSSDLWVSGTFTSVQHFDGVVWAKLAVQASGTIAVTAAPDRVLFPGATEDFVELLR